MSYKKSRSAARQSFRAWLQFYDDLDAVKCCYHDDQYLYVEDEESLDSLQIIPPSKISLQDYICDGKERYKRILRRGEKRCDKRVKKHHPVNCTVKKDSTKASTNNISSVEVSQIDIEFQSRYGDLALRLNDLDPNLCFSRLGGGGFRASTRILCATCRVAFLLLWSSPNKNSSNRENISIDVQLVPVVNCSVIDDASLMMIAQRVSNRWVDQLVKELRDISEVQSLTADRDIFYNLTKVLISKPNIYEMCNSLASLMESEVPKYNDHCQATRFKKIMERSIFDVKVSSDHFDVFGDVDNTDTKQLNGNCQRPINSNACCIVCFDEFGEDDALYLSACNHRACISCWRGLLRSASSSGDFRIQCPAYLCQNTVSIRDCCHILFNRDLKQDKDDYTAVDSSILDDVQIAMNLTRYRIEHHLVKCLSKHCVTPSCNSIFGFDKSKENKIHSNKGYGISMCSCGASRCLKCLDKSHPGISCDTHARLRKDMMSGKLDAEARSIEWVFNNSSPCPKCFSPIKKNGGCNHISCSKCGHYFCWICGGPGFQCGSYSCRNQSRGGSTVINTFNIDTEHSSYHSHNIEKNISFIQVLKEHAADEKALEAVFRSNMKSTEMKEFQLRQVISWTSVLLVSAIDLHKTATIAQTRAHLKKLRSFLSIFNPESDTNADHEPIDKIEKQLISPYQRTIPRRKNCHLSKFTKKAMERENKEDHRINILDAATVMDIITFQSMTKSASNIYISKAIDQTYQHVFPPVRPKHLKEKKELALVTQVCPLNRKLEPMKSWWKNCNAANNGTDDSKSTCHEKMFKQQDKKLKWKGKHIVKARRSVALNR